MLFIIFLSAFSVLGSLAFAGSVSESPLKEAVSESTVREILAHFPSSPEQIERLANEAVKEIDLSTKIFNNLETNQLNYQNVVMGWNKLVNTFIWKQALLTFFSMTTQDKQLIAKAEMEAEKLAEKIVEILSDDKSINIVLSYARKVIENPHLELLSPSQVYNLGSLLETIKDGVPVSQKESISALELHTKLSQQTMMAFTYVKGDAVNKGVPKNRNISILNWNVCCFDGGLSMLFGGVLPWQSRIDRIALFLKNSGADIICLQELFSTQATDQLTAQLKDQYAHFYIHIGPKISGFNARALGIPSGLFVASKYPLKNPLFHPYNAEETPLNRGYGFFTAEFADSMNTPVCIVTTHLEPGSDPIDIKFRHAQLKAILVNIDDKIPTFLCGDLNIERNSKEYKSKIAPFFLNSYTGPAWTACDLKNYWWKAKQNTVAFNELGLPTEWIDYFLTLTKNPGTVVKTDLIIANDPSYPTQALSDHQAMISIIHLK